MNPFLFASRDKVYSCSADLFGHEVMRLLLFTFDFSDIKNRNGTSTS